MPGARHPLDAATGEDPVGVAIDQQRQQHVRVVLGRAGAALVALELAPVQALDGLDDEMRQVVFGQPVEQVGGQQERQVPVAGNELCRRATRFYFSL